MVNRGNQRPVGRTTPAHATCWKEQIIEQVISDREGVIRHLVAKAEKAILGVLCREAAVCADGYAAVKIRPDGTVHVHKSPSWECGPDEFHQWTPRSLTVWERTTPHGPSSRDVFAWRECDDGEYLGDPATRNYFRVRDRSDSWVADRLAVGWVRFDIDDTRFANPEDHVDRAELRRKIDGWVDMHYIGDAG
jgi:hypothetical protein